MEPETQIQYISLDGLPSVAAEITADSLYPMVLLVYVGVYELKSTYRASM